MQRRGTQPPVCEISPPLLLADVASLVGANRLSQASAGRASCEGDREQKRSC